MQSRWKQHVVYSQSQVTISTVSRKIIKACTVLLKKPGVHSSIALKSAGFYYIDVGDTTRCESCGLEVSKWTIDMIPFQIHAKRSPNCCFVKSVRIDYVKAISTTETSTFISVTLADDENPTKRQKTDEAHELYSVPLLSEVDILKQVRTRAFSHWPHQTAYSSEQMIEAGFFSCNVGDRVICIYCNLICQQWNPNTDDPSAVHKILSPKCPYVKGIIEHGNTSSTSVVNVCSDDHSASTTNNQQSTRSHGAVTTMASHSSYSEISRRLNSFSSWPTGNLPSVEELAKAGFFYTGQENVVTCFYCHGSLQNWGPRDNPIIEHVRWFPHCEYARQSCGEDLYNRVQRTQKHQQERLMMQTSNQGFVSRTNSVSRERLIFPDESTLSRYVAARLDLSISQRLLSLNVKLSIIKRCYEDQLKLRKDDFIDDCDLFIACLVLQKQISCIGGKKENIIVPTIAMRKIRQREQAEAQALKETSNASKRTNRSSNIAVEMSGQKPVHNEAGMATSSGTPDQHVQTLKASATDMTVHQAENNDVPSLVQCPVCLKEEKRLACIPCGHLATCISCSQTLRLCPICRREIEAYVRIFI